MADHFKSQLILDKLPQHIAIIMDGNGRWAKQNGQPRLFGHKNGVAAVRNVTEAAAEIGVPFLTLYAFSTENWSRPQTEVLGLMNLLVETIKSELKTLNKNNVRLRMIGDVSMLPEKTKNTLLEGIENTKNNTRLNLVLALNYSSKSEILRAVNSLIEDAKSGKLHTAVDETIFTKQLYTADIPDPELLIRTSGELRISNFLLWQLAYSEFYFTNTLWPDFTKEHFYEAIYQYQQRERRFGKTSDQIQQG